MGRLEEQGYIKADDGKVIKDVVFFYDDSVDEVGIWGRQVIFLNIVFWLQAQEFVIGYSNFGLLYLIIVIWVVYVFLYLVDLGVGMDYIREKFFKQYQYCKYYNV